MWMACGRISRLGIVVSWDLIQNNAISSVTLLSGSDPLLG